MSRLCKCGSVIDSPSGQYHCKPCKNQYNKEYRRKNAKMKIKKYKMHLTNYQRQEIIKSTESNIALAKIYNVIPATISQIRVKAGVGVGRGSAGNFKLTKDQRQEIIDSDLPNVELAKIYGIAANHVSKIKVKAGKGRFRSPKGESKRKKEKSTKEVSIAVKFKLLDSKKPKPEKAKPLKVHVEKVKLQASMSFEEQQYLIRQKAKESQKKQTLTDSEKLKLGTHKWIERVDRFGKKSKVLSKI